MPQRDFSYGLGGVANEAKSFGATLGGLLKDRINKKEYDDFLAGPNKDLSDSMRSAQDLLLDESNPDAPMQGVKMLQGGLQTYMDEAAKYPDNPLVANRAQQTFNMNMGFLKQEFVMQHQAAATTRQKSLDEATIAGKKAEALKNLGLAKKYSGQSDIEAQKLNPLFSGMPDTIQGADADEKATNMWNAISERASKPQTPTERAQQDVEKGDIRMNRARAMISEMAGRGEVRNIPSKVPGGLPDQHVYDPHSKSDLDAVAGMVDQDQVNAEWTMRVAQREATKQGLDPQIFDKKYGVLVDPSRASAFNPIDKAIPEPTVGKIMMGTAGWSQLFDPNTKTEPKSVKEAATRLPADINKASGPLVNLFQQMPSVAKEEGIDSLDKLQKQMLIHGTDIVNQTFGPNKRYDQLDEGQKKNRDAANELVKAMTLKYSNQIAERMGIVKPKPAPRAGMTDSQIGNLPGIGDIFRIGGQAINKGKRLINEYTE
jgi:hypothetical protein